MDTATEVEAVSLGLALFGVAAAIYELYAVRTERVPTITHMVRATPVPVRVGIVGVAVAAIVDHFLTGVVL